VSGLKPRGVTNRSRGESDCCSFWLCGGGALFRRKEQTTKENNYTPVLAILLRKTNFIKNKKTTKHVNPRNVRISKPWLVINFRMWLRSGFAVMPLVKN